MDNLIIIVVIVSSLLSHEKIGKNESLTPNLSSNKFGKIQRSYPNI